MFGWSGLWGSWLRGWRGVPWLILFRGLSYRICCMRSPWYPPWGWVWRSRFSPCSFRASGRTESAYSQKCHWRPRTKELEESQKWGYSSDSISSKRLGKKPKSKFFVRNDSGSFPPSEGQKRIKIVITYFNNPIRSHLVVSHLNHLIPGIVIGRSLSNLRSQLEICLIRLRVSSFALFSPT